MGRLKDFSIQLYSLREMAESDFEGMLRLVSQIGFTGVEFAGCGGYSAPEMAALLKKYNLHSVGAHIALDKLQNSLGEELAYHKAIGTQNIIVPYAAVSNRQEVMSLAEQLCVIGPEVKEAGFTFAYHNHAHEFEKEDDMYLLDILLDNVPAHLLSLELDVYWAQYAGVDYMAYIQKHQERIHMLHLKQMADIQSKRCVDLGDGIINFDALLTIGMEQGIEHYVLEQEEFAVSAKDSLENGFKHIMSL